MFIPPLWMLKWLKPAAGAILVLVVIWQVHAFGARKYAAGEKANEAVWLAKVSEARQARIDEYEAGIAKAKADLARSQADSADLAAKLKDGQAVVETLQTALARARLTTRATPTPENPHPDVRLSSDFRVCIQAAVDGTADSAARCTAVGVREPATAGTGAPAP